MGTLFIIGLVTVSFSAQAQQGACVSRETILQYLATKYSEEPVAIGIANNGGVIEVIASAGGGTWTIIITMPSGVSCLLATGRVWETVTPKKGVSS